MAERLNETELALIKKSIASPDKLTSADNEKLEYLKAKPVRVEDLVTLLDTKYPTPTDVEMDLTKRLIESQGTLNVTSEEARTLDEIQTKRASLQDVVDIVMSAYKGSLANRYRDLKDQLFLVQIMLRDQVVAKNELKKLAKKLNATGDLSDEGLKKVNTSKLVMSTQDYKDAAKTREDAYTKVVDEMNKQTELIDKVQQER